MLLKSSSYPKTVGKPMREKVCDELAAMLDQLGDRIKSYGRSPTTPESPTRQTSLPADSAPNPAEERHERCRQIGRTLHQTREERARTREWLHTRTRIPLHQIRAIEEGRINELPEDIYLRSFIRQMGNSLGLNGNELATSLPVQSAAVVPNWYQPSSPSFNLQFSSTQFYFGYATLLLGAVSGLSWLSEWVPQVSFKPHEGSSLQELKKNQNSLEDAPVQAGANMAPPETLEG